MSESTRRSEPDSAVRTTVERRKAPRSPLVVRVSYATVDALFCEFARNVNEGGLFIESEDPLPPETHVVLHFQLPGSNQPIRTEGRVAWTRAGGEDLPAGMGVEFEDLRPTDRARIDELVRRLRARGATVGEDSSSPSKR